MGNFKTRYILMFMLTVFAFNFVVSATDVFAEQAVVETFDIKTFCNSDEYAKESPYKKAYDLECEIDNYIKKGETEKAMMSLVAEIKENSDVGRDICDHYNIYITVRLAYAYKYTSVSVLKYNWLLEKCQKIRDYNGNFEMVDNYNISFLREEARFLGTLEDEVIKLYGVAMDFSHISAIDLNLIQNIIVRYPDSKVVPYLCYLRALALYERAVSENSSSSALELADDAYRSLLSKYNLSKFPFSSKYARKGALIASFAQAALGDLYLYQNGQKTLAFQGQG